MNEYERQRRIAESTKKLYPPGTRIELIHMNDPHALFWQAQEEQLNLLIQWERYSLSGITIEPLVSFPVRTHSESSHRKKSKQKTNLNQKLKMKLLMRIAE